MQQNYIKLRTALFYQSSAFISSLPSDYCHFMGAYPLSIK